MSLQSLRLAAALSLMTAVAEAQCLRADVLPEGVSAGAYFGRDVAADGQRFVVSALGIDEVWVYELEDRHAYLEQRLVAPNGASSFGFGQGLALDGNRLVVGHPGDGIAYVYEDDGHGFVETARLSVAPAITWGTSGWGLDADGDRVAVGVPWERFNGKRTGVVTVFAFDGSTWSTETQLVGSGANTDWEFGRSVSLEGGRLAIGAPHVFSSLAYSAGEVYVFELDESEDTWAETAIVTPAGAQFQDQVGHVVDLAGDRMIVSANTANGYRGEVYVFDREAEGWREVARLGPGSVSFGYFGGAAALSHDGSLIAIAAPGEFDYAGLVHLYRRSDSGAWVQERELRTPAFESSASFGSSLALLESDLIVGAVGNDAVSEDAGAAHVYSLDASVCRSLDASAGALSLTSGGVQTLFLDAGAEHAGRRYVLAGSSSGTAPGTIVGGARVPLVRDPYTSLSLHPARSWLTHGSGTLDRTGSAAALLNVPAGLPPSLAGRILHHAFLVFDEEGNVVHVSNGTRTALRP